MDADVDRPGGSTDEGSGGAEAHSAGGMPKKRGGGPKTAEGRRRSSANSLIHGLRAKVLLPDELAAAFQKYQTDLTEEYKPSTEHQRYLVADMALSMAQSERCSAMSLADLHACLDSAWFDWEDERQAAAEKLGKRLPGQPSLVSHALEQTVQGLEWKIERWEGFRVGIRDQETCSDELRRLAFNLMGVPLELRSADYRVPAASDSPGLRALAEREIARLTQRRDTKVAPRDASRREHAKAAMPLEEHPRTASLRRYEATLFKKLQWAEAQLNKGTASTPADPENRDPNDSPLTPFISKEGVKYQVTRLAGGGYEVSEILRPTHARAHAKAAAAGLNGASGPGKGTSVPKEAPPATVKPAAEAAKPAPAAVSPSEDVTGQATTPPALAAAAPSIEPRAADPAPPGKADPRDARGMKCFQHTDAKRRSRRAENQARKAARRRKKRS